MKIAMKRETHAATAPKLEALVVLANNEVKIDTMTIKMNIMTSFQVLLCTSVSAAIGSICTKQRVVDIIPNSAFFILDSEYLSILLSSSNFCSIM